MTLSTAAASLGLLVILLDNWLLMKWVKVAIRTMFNPFHPSQFSSSTTGSPERLQQLTVSFPAYFDITMKHPSNYACLHISERDTRYPRMHT